MNEALATTYKMMKTLKPDVNVHIGFVRDCQKMLNDNILSFWTRQMIDPIGGFYGRIDGRGKLHEQADKGVILNTRILWAFSAAYPVTGNPKHKMMADRAYEYVTRYFLDKKHGGVYWMLNNHGEPVNDKKQIYAQAFAIYALAEYHKVNQYKRALDHAIMLFELVESHSFDAVNNGYIEALSREWTELEDVRLSDKDMNATKTMNTHLHVLEAYTNLYRIWPNPTLKEKLTNLIELMSNQFVSERGHFHLFFDNEWKLLSHEVSFGHDIEGSWLLCEAAEVLKDESLKFATEQLALRMVNASMEGFDTDGGLMNEADPDGITDSEKHWWPQAEAMVGLLNAWEITGEQQYFDQLEKLWIFIKSNIMDKEGEWNWKVNRFGDNELEEDKAGPWKGPYHNGRAMLETMRRLS